MEPLLAYDANRHTEADTDTGVDNVTDICAAILLIIEGTDMDTITQ
jgi:hypothetical protein